MARSLRTTVFVLLPTDCRERVRTKKSARRCFPFLRERESFWGRTREARRSKADFSRRIFLETTSSIRATRSTTPDFLRNDTRFAKEGFFPRRHAEETRALPMPSHRRSPTSIKRIIHALLSRPRVSLSPLSHSMSLKAVAHISISLSQQHARESLSSACLKFMPEFVDGGNARHTIAQLSHRQRLRRQFRRALFAQRGVRRGANRRLRRHHRRRHASYIQDLRRSENEMRQRRWRRVG